MNKNDNRSDDIFSTDTDEFSLESILAEYKGSAFIDGDKKTPADVLNAETERIIMETTGKLPPVEENVLMQEPETRQRREARPNTETSMPPKPKEPETQPRREAQQKETSRPSEPKKREIIESHEPKVRSTERENIVIFPPRPGSEQKKSPEPTDDPKIEADELSALGLSDADIRFFQNYNYAKSDSVKEFAEEVSKAVKEEEAAEERSALYKRSRLFLKPKTAKTPIESDIGAEIPASDPDFTDESDRFASRVASMTYRAGFSFVVCIVMAVLTFAFEGGKNVPFGIGTNQPLLGGVLLLMQIIVMLLCVDVLIDGISDFFTSSPGAESLVTIACIVTSFDAFNNVIRGSVTTGLPFCLITSVSLMFALFGRMLYRKGMSDTLRTVGNANLPSGIYSDFNSLNDRAILKKTSVGTAGFYMKLTEADVSENAYAVYVPLALIASLVFALLATIVKSKVSEFTYFFSALISVTASFSALTAYALPFRIIARQMRRSGSAIAGWGGACEIFDSDGALITDQDLFPSGKLAMTGIKLFEGVSSQKAIGYTSSLIIASGSGLSSIFSELLRSQGLSLSRVEDFACYEGGGIGAVIKGERILVGSSGFMKLMGIRVPDKVNMTNAVFTAVNGELIGVFSIEYTPANSVQSALVTMFRSKITLLLAVRDFNVTPQMLQQKFKVPLAGIEYIPVEDCYRISDDNIPKGCDTIAVVTRSGLGAFSEIINKGRQLKTIAELSTAVSLISSVLGLLIMFYFCWSDAFESSSVGNIFLYMVLVHILTILFNLLTRRHLFALPIRKNA